MRAISTFPLSQAKDWFTDLSQRRKLLREVLFETLGLSLAVIEPECVIVNDIASESSIRISDIERPTLLSDTLTKRLSLCPYLALLLEQRSSREARSVETQRVSRSRPLHNSQWVQRCTQRTVMRSIDCCKSGAVV